MTDPRAAAQSTLNQSLADVDREWREFLGTQK